MAANLYFVAPFRAIGTVFMGPLILTLAHRKHFHHHAGKIDAACSSAVKSPRSLARNTGVEMFHIRLGTILTALCLYLGCQSAPSPAVDAIVDGMLNAIDPSTGVAVRGPLPPDTLPRIIRRVEPEYPPVALQEKTQGVVTVQISISTEGKVTEATVVEGIPEGGFDRQALKAVRKWEFEPSLRDGDPVGMRIVTPLIFELDPAAFDDPGARQRRADELYTMGAGRSAEGENREALGIFRELISLAPRNPDAYYGLGFTYQTIGELTLAHHYYNAATSLNCQNPHVYLNRGTVLLGLGEFEHAIGDFGRFIEFDPDDPRGYSGRALASMATGNHSRACEDLQKACELGDCGALDSLREIGLCTDDFDFAQIARLIRSEQYEEGVPRLGRCAESGHGGCMALLGQIYTEGKGVPESTERALYWNERAYQTGTAYGFAGVHAASSLGLIYLDGIGVEKDPERALLWLENAHKLCLDPDLSEWYPNHLTEFCPDIELVMREARSAF